MTRTMIENVSVYEPTDGSRAEGPLYIEALDEGMSVGFEQTGPIQVRIDGGGGVVVPGFIDAHFHAYGISLNVLGIESSPLSYVAAKASGRLGRALRRGFTTVRDVAGGDIGLSKAVTEGLIASPRYLFTGPALSQSGGHGDPRPGDSGLVPCCPVIGEVVDGVDAIRRAVRERFRTGAHAIKLMTSGGVVSPTDPLRVPQYSAEEVRAATEEAARRESYVAAHAYSSEAIVHSVENGVRTIEHGNLTTRRRRRWLLPGPIWSPLSLPTTPWDDAPTKWVSTRWDGPRMPRCWRPVWAHWKWRLERA